MQEKVIIHSNPYSGEYFFSTDHCQRPKTSGTYPEGFVAVTHYLPSSVVPRPELPSGRCETAKDIITVFYSGPLDREIPNPDPSYQG